MHVREGDTLITKEEHERRKLMQELRQKEALYRSKEPNFYWFSATSHLNIPVRRRRLSGNPGSKSPAEWEA